MVILASQISVPGRISFYVSRIACSSQPCTSIPRRAARLSAAYNKAQSCSPAAKLAQKALHICMAGEQGGADIHTAYPNNSLDLITAGITTAAFCSAAGSLVLHPGAWLPSVCGLRSTSDRKEQASGSDSVSTHSSALSKLLTRV